MATEFLLKENLITNLWGEYMHDPDYTVKKRIRGIASNHPIVIKREEMGLEEVYRKHIINKLKTGHEIDQLPQRTAAEWITEWKAMHNLLFKRVLITSLRGCYREVDVRFGNPEDVEIRWGYNDGTTNTHWIPPFQAVPLEIENFASTLQNHYLARTDLSRDEKIEVLAQIQYNFVRIHPFRDGNGRLARVITDQIALYFGFPTAMSSYPRTDKNRRIKYHEAINACMQDPTCSKLAEWIRSYIEVQISKIA